MGSEWFWKVSESSEAFLNIVVCSVYSEVFSSILSSSERFLKVLCHFLTTWAMLGGPKALLYIPNNFERFLNVLRHSLTFWHSDVFLVSSERFWKVTKSSETFIEVLGCSEHSCVFSCILSSLLIVIEASVLFYDILGFFEAFCGVYDVLRYCDVLWSVLKLTDGIWVILKGSICSEASSDVLAYSKVL